MEQAKINITFNQLMQLLKIAVSGAQGVYDSSCKVEGIEPLEKIVLRIMVAKLLLANSKHSFESKGELSAYADLCAGIDDSLKTLVGPIE